MNLTTGEIVCADLTTDNVGDTTALLGLLDQLDTRIARFLADGAYDGAPTSDLLKARFGETVEIIIPPPRMPPKNAIFSPQSTFAPTLRDRHSGIDTQGSTLRDRHSGIGTLHPWSRLGCGLGAWVGRMGWQSSSGYNERSRVGSQMRRCKAIIGPKLKARSIENQQTEEKTDVTILNKMTELGRPKFEVVN